MPLPRSKHYLCLAGLFMAMPILASDADDTIAACARLASTGDRILCLEDALRSLDSTEATDSENPAEEMSAAIPEIEYEVLVAADAVAESAPPAELGAEQVARQNDVEEEQVRINAKIVDHTLVGTGRLRLTLDNGQVWQQTGDDDDRIARKIRGQTDIDVEMWQSRSGGYRMLLVDIDRTLRVRRLE